MLTAPWVKRIELQGKAPGGDAIGEQGGECRSMPLEAGKPFITAIHETEGFNDTFQFDGQSWFHVTQRERRWALHGTTASSGSALYTFMEFPEARHPEFEASLATDAAAIEVYADWLEEQGDPYAAALKPALLKERGPAGRWFLEGLDRSGQIEFTLRDALVREVKVNVDSSHLLATLHRLVHLRACVALEKVHIEPRSLGQSGDVGRWTMWRDLRWPRSMKSLVLARVNDAAREAVEKSARVKVTAK